MKQKISVLLVFLFVVFTGCSKQYTPVDNHVPEEVIAEANEEVTEEATEEVLEEITEEATAEATTEALEQPPNTTHLLSQSWQSWQEAYTELLQEYVGKALFPHDACEEERLAGSFSLYDIDLDGVPELFIWKNQPQGFFHAYSAYTFDENTIIPLEFGEFIGGRNEICTPPNSQKGMILVTGESGHTRYNLVVMNDYVLYNEVSAYEDYTPEQISLHYIRGVDVTPIEFPDSERAQAWYEEHTQIWHEEYTTPKGYTLVAEDDFYRVIDSVFGDLDTYILSTEITELENIYGILREYIVR
ncbi:MAG: hypothetical protein FWG87_09245 [Defluviitaleaceae bacterium]|nr:hypothetical protein [Defluviitaleaceae bacterium]